MIRQRILEFNWIKMLLWISQICPSFFFCWIKQHRTWKFMVHKYSGKGLSYFVIQAFQTIIHCRLNRCTFLPFCVPIVLFYVIESRFHKLACRLQDVDLVWNFTICFVNSLYVYLPICSKNLGYLRTTSSAFGSIFQLPESHILA